MSEDNLTGKEKTKLLEILSGKKRSEPQRGRPAITDGQKCVRVGFSLPKELDEKFKAVAEAMGMNRSELFRQIVDKFLAHYSSKLDVQKYW